MTLRLSSKLSNSMMDTASLKASLPAFVIDIYGGTIPGTPKFANNVPGSTKLARISLTGTGSALSWETSSTEGQLEKNASGTDSAPLQVQRHGFESALWLMMHLMTTPQRLSIALMVRLGHPEQT